jgi:hypothetical protein
MKQLYYQTMSRFFGLLFVWSSAKLFPYMVVGHDEEEGEVSAIIFGRSERDANVLVRDYVMDLDTRCYTGECPNS